MTQNVITKHFKNDRIERAAYISQTVGFGEVVKVLDVYEDGRFSRRELMDTGVIVIRSINNVIITMFIATEGQIKYIYNGKAPQWIINKARKNKKYMRNQPNT